MKKSLSSTSGCLVCLEEGILRYGSTLIHRQDSWFNLPGDQRLGKNEVDYKKVSYTFRMIRADELPRMAIEYEDN